MKITPSLALGGDWLNSLRTRLNAGGVGNPALIDIYSGTVPSRPDTAIGTQIKLATLTCSVDCGTVATIDGVPTLTFSAITSDAAADATGTAAWGRIRSTGAGAASVLDFDISTTGGTGFGKMNTTNIVVGGPVSGLSVVVTA